MRDEIREKKTTRTGKKIGMRGGATVSITANDADRIVSQMWEHLKRHYSRKHVTAAELGKMVFMRGAMALIEEIEAEYQRKQQEFVNDNQGKLF